jgi:peptide/nickel transport system substrate-binding protein
VKRKNSQKSTGSRFPLSLSVRRIAAVLILVLAVLAPFPLTGCGEFSDFLQEEVSSAISETAEEEAEEEKNLPQFGLEYSADASLNPLMTESQANMDMLDAVYDRLVELDGRFMPQPVLCSSFKGDGERFVFEIREDVFFHDGELLTASDVVYSLQYVSEQPLSPYHNRLRDVSGIESAGNTVIVTLSRKNSYFVSLLDIPIIRKNAASKDPFFPVGTGSYRYTRIDEENVLQAVEKPWRGDVGRIDLIRLYDTSQAERRLYYFESGDVDLLKAQMSESQTLADYGEFNHRDIPTAQLTFLAPNTRDSRLKTGTVARGISAYLSRDEIVGKTLANGALATALPCHPVWGAIQTYTPPLMTPAQATDALGDAGYGPDADGILVGNGTELIFRLLVNGDNQMKVSVARHIAEQLRPYGIEMKLVELSWEDYHKALAEGDFDFYLGEVKQMSDMNADYLFAPDGAQNYGQSKAPATLAAASAFRESDNPGTLAEDTAAYCTTFLREMPIIPLYYGQATLVYKKDFVPPVLSFSASRAYGALAQWKYAAASSVPSPPNGTE